jgi:hypothetical protein
MMNAECGMMKEYGKQYQRSDRYRETAGDGLNIHTEGQRLRGRQRQDCFCYGHRDSQRNRERRKQRYCRAANGLNIHTEGQRLRERQRQDFVVASCRNPEKKGLVVL